MTAPARARARACGVPVARRGAGAAVALLALVAWAHALSRVHRRAPDRPLAAAAAAAAPLDAEPAACEQLDSSRGPPAAPVILDWQLHPCVPAVVAARSARWRWVAELARAWRATAGEGDRDGGGGGDLCAVPFGSWARALSPGAAPVWMHAGSDAAGGGGHWAVPCDGLDAACAAALRRPPEPPRPLVCPGGAPGARLRVPATAGWGDVALDASRRVECAVSTSARDGAAARGVMLDHTGLSAASQGGLLGWWGGGRQLGDDAARADSLLWPCERRARSARAPRAAWALRGMWESAVYYPAVAQPAIKARFDLRWGSYRRHINGAHVLSYPPDWERLAAPVNWTAKAAARLAVGASAAVAWVASNCDSRSGREAYVRGLMRHLAVDSFGACLHTRDAGANALAADYSNWGDVFPMKRRLLAGYKFVLVLENSVDEDYVTEKIMHAWEAGAVPLYLGAPNIAEFALGPRSFVDLRGMTHAQVAALVATLDADPGALAAYHAWRGRPAEALRDGTPLGRLAGAAAARPEPPECDVCRLAHHAAAGAAA